MELEKKIRGKNKIIMLLSIVLVILILLFVFKIKGVNIFGSNNLTLPIYEIENYNKTDTFLHFNIKSISNKYELNRVIKCKYDNCYWVDVEHSTTENSDWLFYDNNYENEGGYYFYDHKNFKIKNDVYKSVSFDASDSDVVLGAVVSNKANKYGYYSLIKNKIVIPAENYRVSSYEYKAVAVQPTESSKYAIYNPNGEKLTENIYDEVIDPSDSSAHLLITKKEEKYNGFYCDFGKNLTQYIAFENDYEYLDFVYYDRKINTVYYLYGKDNKVYISMSSIPFVDKTPLTISDSLNKLVIDNYQGNDIYSYYYEDKNSIIVEVEGVEKVSIINLDTGKITQEEYFEEE